METAAHGAMIRPGRMRGGLYFQQQCPFWSPHPARRNNIIESHLYSLPVRVFRHALRGEYAIRREGFVAGLKGTWFEGDLSSVRTDSLPLDIVRKIDARFRSPLMSFFLRRVGDRAIAEDLTQDVFERLLKADQRGGIEDVEALVFVTAGNLLKDRARKAIRRGNATLQDIDAANVSTVTGEFMEDRHPERVLLAKESIGDVLQALEELGSRARDVFVLFRLEGMKQAEIATFLGIGRSTVEKDVMRATAHLALRFGRGR